MGLLCGITLMVVSHVAHVYIILGLPDSWYLVAAAMLGACLGALIGTLVLLPTEPAARVAA